MADHSPGPWKILKSRDGKTLHISSGGSNWDDLDCDVDSDDKDFDIAMANARLIAAAPDLLAALTELESLIWEWRTTGKQPAFVELSKADEDARAAIAKAKGVQP